MTASRRTPSAQISIVVEEPLWRAEGRNFPTDLRNAARTALADGRKKRPCGAALTLLLAGDAKLQALNAQFRGKDKPTNVLSFPSADPAYLGDVAIAYGVAAGEAAEARKSLHDHAVHLAVHGVLHLLGYDHETARKARIMEPLETAILAKLRIKDPYAASRSGRSAAE